MATRPDDPEIPAPDRIEPQSPPEIDPVGPDIVEPGRGPDELPTS